MFTLGPQRGPFVAQHISVLHTEQRIQSQPTFLVTMTLQPGQCIASPSFTNAYKKEHKKHTEGALNSTTVFSLLDTWAFIILRSLFTSCLKEGVQLIYTCV